MPFVAPVTSATLPTNRFSIVSTLVASRLGRLKMAIGFHGEPVRARQPQRQPDDHELVALLLSHAATSSSNCRLSEISIPIAATCSGWIGYVMPRRRSARPRRRRRAGTRRSGARTSTGSCRRGGRPCPRRRGVGCCPTRPARASGGGVRCGTRGSRPRRSRRPPRRRTPRASARPTASPGSSHFTPRCRGMSSSTPRPTTPWWYAAMSCSVAPFDGRISSAALPLYVSPPYEMWQSASTCVCAVAVRRHAEPVEAEAHLASVDGDIVPLDDEQRRLHRVVRARDLVDRDRERDATAASAQATPPRAPSPA